MKEAKVEDALSTTIADLESQMAVMVDYLKMKLTTRDWHGIRDAAVDIELLARELEIWKGMR